MAFFCICEDGRMQAQYGSDDLIDMMKGRFTRRNVDSFFKSKSYIQFSKDAGFETFGSQSSGNITHMINQRELGQFKYAGFSHAKKCRIYSTYLPNKMEVVQSFPNSILHHSSFTEDGEYLIIVSLLDYRVRVFNKHFEIIRDVPYHGGHEMEPLRYSLSTEYFAHTDVFGRIHMIPITLDDVAEKCFNPLGDDTTEKIRPSITFSGDGKEILGATDLGIIYICDANTNQISHKIKTESLAIKSLAFSDFSSNILLCANHNENVIKIWDKRMPFSESEFTPPAKILVGHRKAVICVTSKNDGRHLISQGLDDAIKLWDIRSGWSNLNYIPPFMDQSLTSFFGHKVSLRVPSCKFSPVETTGQRYIYTACTHGHLFIYDIITGKIEIKISPGGRNLRGSFAWHPINNEIYVTHFPRSFGRWVYSPEHKVQSEDP